MPVAALTPWQAWNAPIIFWQVRIFGPGCSCVKHYCDMKWHVSCGGGGIQADVSHNSHRSRIRKIDGEAWGPMPAHQWLIERLEDLVKLHTVKYRQSQDVRGRLLISFPPLGLNRVPRSWRCVCGWFNTLRDQVQRMKNIYFWFRFMGYKMELVKRNRF